MRVLDTTENDYGPNGEDYIIGPEAKGTITYIPSNPESNGIMVLRDSGSELISEYNDLKVLVKKNKPEQTGMTFSEIQKAHEQFGVNKLKIPQHPTSTGTANLPRVQREQEKKAREWMIQPSIYRCDRVSPFPHIFELCKKNGWILVREVLDDK